MKYARRKTVKNRRRIHKKLVGGNTQLRKQYLSNSAIELDNLNTSVLQESIENLDKYLKTVAIKPDDMDSEEFRVKMIRESLQRSLDLIEDSRSRLVELNNV